MLFINGRLNLPYRDSIPFGEPWWFYYDGEGYLYTGGSLIAVLWQMLTEWKHDKHIVG